MGKLSSPPKKKYKKLQKAQAARIQSWLKWLKTSKGKTWMFSDWLQLMLMEIITPEELHEEIFASFDPAVDSIQVTGNNRRGGYISIPLPNNWDHLLQEKYK
jgi:hypothetical protein